MFGAWTHTFTCRVNLNIKTNMQIGAILTFLGLTLASTITFPLAANSKECFYTFNTQSHTNIGYYFAVQSGGSFDVDYYIKSPDGKIIVSEEKQRQGDYVFNANQVGEYEFCFDNSMSTFAEKVIDFELRDNDATNVAELPAIPKGNKAVEGMQAIVDSIETKLARLTQSMHYYKTRMNRNQSTVKSTEGRILIFTFFDLAIMLAMAVFQIAVVQFFFKGSRKQLV